MNKDVVEYLKKIYTSYKKQGNKNPFRVYMEEEHNDKNPIYLKFVLNGIENKIRNISFASTKNKKDKYFENKKIGCINKSFNSIAADCYYRDGKWFVIPLNVNTWDFNKNVRASNYFFHLKKMNLVENNFKFRLKNGQPFVDNEDNIFYYVSYRQCDKKFEIKPIDYDYKAKNGVQLTIPIDRFFKNFKICDIDILGNKYKKNI